MPDPARPDAPVRQPAHHHLWTTTHHRFRRSDPWVGAGTGAILSDHMTLSNHTPGSLHAVIPA